MIFYLYIADVMVVVFTMGFIPAISPYSIFFGTMLAAAYWRWYVHLKRSNALSLFLPYVVSLLGVINRGDLLILWQVYWIPMCGLALTVFHLNPYLPGLVPRLYR